MGPHLLVCKHASCSALDSSSVDTYCINSDHEAAERQVLLMITPLLFHLEGLVTYGTLTVRLNGAASLSKFYKYPVDRRSNGHLNSISPLSLSVSPPIWKAWNMPFPSKVWGFDLSEARWSAFKGKNMFDKRWPYLRRERLCMLFFVPDDLKLLTSYGALHSVAYQLAQTICMGASLSATVSMSRYNRLQTHVQQYALTQTGLRVLTTNFFSPMMLLNKPIFHRLNFTTTISLRGRSLPSHSAPSSPPYLVLNSSCWSYGLQEHRTPGRTTIRGWFWRLLWPLASSSLLS